jgi:hypothetical protein
MGLDAGLGVAAPLADPGRYRVVEVRFDGQHLGQEVADGHGRFAAEHELDPRLGVALLLLEVEELSACAVGQ